LDGRGIEATMKIVALALAVAVLGGTPAAAQDRPPEAGAVIPLWPEGVPGLLPTAGPEVVADDRVSNVHAPSLLAYLAPAGHNTGTAAIICPGGGYTRLAIDHEGFAVARWLNGLGVSAFILKYRLKEYGHPAPLRDVLRAVRLVRAAAPRWGIDPARLGVIGFSAGGHLASTAGTLYDAPEGRTGADLDRVSARPDFLVLVYPVISLRPPYAHAGSREALLGKNPPADLVDHLSTDLQVTRDTPPTFLVHTTADTTVPVENSINFYLALRRAGVPAEMHVYVAGPHGFGMNPGHGPTSDWPARCAEWMTATGLIGRPAAPPSR
jgi:acetyl esterase/lipase